MTGVHYAHPAVPDRRQARRYSDFRRRSRASAGIAVTRPPDRAQIRARMREDGLTVPRRRQPRCVRSEARRPARQRECQLRPERGSSSPRRALGGPPRIARNRPIPCAAPSLDRRIGPLPSCFRGIVQRAPRWRHSEVRWRCDSDGRAWARSRFEREPRKDSPSVPIDSPAQDAQDYDTVVSHIGDHPAASDSGHLASAGSLTSCMAYHQTRG